MIEKLKTAFLDCTENLFEEMFSKVRSVGSNMVNTWQERLASASRHGENTRTCMQTSLLGLILGQKVVNTPLLGCF